MRKTLKKGKKPKLQLHRKMKKTLNKPKLKTKKVTKKPRHIKSEKVITGFNGKGFSPFRVFDEEDVKQIVSAGKITGSPFYQVDVEDDRGGRVKVFGISYLGTRQIQSMQGNIIIDNYAGSENETEYISVVRGYCSVRNISVYGLGNYPKNVQEPFGRRISLSFAQRNAIRALLLTENIEKAFKAWWKKIFNENPDMSQVQIITGESGETIDFPDKGKGQ